MKKMEVGAVIMIFIVISCKRGEIFKPAANQVLIFKQNQEPIPDKEAFTSIEIRQKVMNELKAKNDFHWSTFDLHFIWSAAQITQLVAVGYKPAFAGIVEDQLHSININSNEWKSVHDSILSLVTFEVNKNQTKKFNPKDLVEEDDPVLPIIIFRLTDKSALTKLYNLENVRYLEPYGYWPYQDRSSSGCGGSSTAVDFNDWSTIQPNCILPWNYNNLNITSAWSVSQGEGIQIGVIDAGISNTQTLLNGQFNSGFSNNGRTITSEYTYGTSVFSACTHGTSMCGLAAGPRNNQNAVTGIAYKSSLHFIRGCDDVVLDQSSELSGVKNALVRLANMPTMRIISMSIGTPFYSSVLYDGVSYAFGKGKMIFAAAGTSFSWTSWWGVVYPASFPQCIAVTGVKENGSTCTTCHDGSQVKFTIPMERNSNNDRNSLSLPQSGFSPTYIGGSSCATASAAGIAALVWSVKPSMTVSQVFNCMKMTAQYPLGVANHGYGNLNAAAAVGMAQGQ
jgi:serine protease